MRTLLSDGRLFLAEWVDGGSTPTTPRVVNRINEAQLRLFSKTLLSEWLLRWWVNAVNGAIVPPYKIEGLYGVRRLGMPITIVDQVAEFAGNGPGEQDVNIGFQSLCVNKGSSPLYYDLYGTRTLECITNSTDDLGKVVKFRGIGGVPWQSTVVSFTVPDVGLTADATLNQTYTAGLRLTIAGVGSFLVTNVVGTTATLLNDQGATPGTVVTNGVAYGPVQALPIEEEVAIGTSFGQSSKNFFYSVNYVKKPAMSGQCFVYGQDVSNGNRYIQAIYDCNEILPEYRRFLIPALNGWTGPVEILGKKRFIPAVDDDDELIVGNLPALKLMCMALHEEANHNYKQASELEAMAIRELETADDGNVGAVKPQLGLRHIGYIRNVH